MLRFLFPLFFLSSLSAMLVGDPSQPALTQCGVIFQTPCSFSFRAGYLDDWIYRLPTQEISDDPDALLMHAHFQISTYAGQLTCNFARRLDLYGLVGSSRMQIDEEIFTKRALSWGTGLKLIILQSGDWYLGTDFKYFQTNQKPRYFIIDGQPYNVVNRYLLNYKEYQVAVGVAYQISVCVPYCNVTYLETTMEPVPRKVLVRLPDVDEKVDFPTARMENENKWGAALGLTFLDNKRFTFSVEWRLVNQYAVDWNFDIRF